ncbi:unnamed protein product, partial [Urochloa humidicola]
EKRGALADIQFIMIAPAYHVLSLFVPTEESLKISVWLPLDKHLAEATHPRRAGGKSI